MNFNNNSLMGLCPIDKFVFSNEDTVKYIPELQPLDLDN